MWIADYEADVDARFFRDYGVDYTTLESRRFIRLAMRLGMDLVMPTAIDAGERVDVGASDSYIYNRIKEINNGNIQ